MNTPGVMKASGSMEKNGSAAAIHILVACVVVVLKEPVIFMDSKQHAKDMDTLFITQVMVDETQKKLFLKVQGGKYATPQAPGNRTVGHVIQSINLSFT